MIAYIDSSVVLRVALGQPGRVREWKTIDTESIWPLHCFGPNCAVNLPLWSPTTARWARPHAHSASGWSAFRLHEYAS